MAKKLPSSLAFSRSIVYDHHVYLPMPKRTYQPKTKKRASQTGFLSRLKTVTGSSIISRKRRKGRAVLGTR